MLSCGQSPRAGPGSTQISSTCFHLLRRGFHWMRPLTQYGLMAEKHWRQFRPKMVQELEASGQLHTMLLEAEDQTEKEMDQARRSFQQQGLSPRQAHDRAWEMVRERYIFLPPET